MPIGGARTLWDLALKGEDRLHIRCTKSERVGRYRVALLIETFGKSRRLPDLLVELSADCPRRQSLSTFDRCGAAYGE